MTQQLTAVRDELRKLANYLTETALRAKVSGASMPSFTVEALVSMAAQLFDAVVALERAMGGSGQAPPPSSPGPALQPGPPPVPPPGTDVIASWRKWSEDMNRDMADRVAAIQTQIAAMQADLNERLKPPPQPPAGPTT